MLISVLNLIITAACFVIAGVECHNWHFPSAFAYAGFGLGYVGLAWAYWS